MVSEPMYRSVMASRSGMRSMEITRSYTEQQRRPGRHLPHGATPPHRAMTSPGFTPARSAPIHPVGARNTEQNRALVSSMPSGTGNAP
ncbi:hypothetical protein SGLAM104S_02712 [Streptomyces glaucescens]